MFYWHFANNFFSRFLIVKMHLIKEIIITIEYFFPIANVSFTLTSERRSTSKNLKSEAESHGTHALVATISIKIPRTRYWTRVILNRRLVMRLSVNIRFSSVFFVHFSLPILHIFKLKWIFLVYCIFSIYQHFWWYKKKLFCLKKIVLYNIVDNIIIFKI